MGSLTAKYLHIALFTYGSLAISIASANPQGHYYPHHDTESYYQAAAEVQFGMPPVLQPYQTQANNQQPLAGHVHQQYAMAYTQQQRPVAHYAHQTQPTYQPQVQRASYTRPQASVQSRQQTPMQQGLNPQRRALIDMAQRSLGVRYTWGGNTPSEGFDCSGFTRFAHNKANIHIPRTAAEQSNASRTISRHELRPGDMIFFITSGRTVNHVGIYLGNGKMIHAASGSKHVLIDDLNKQYWQKRLVKYGTFLS